ncbi:hypothetical protein CDAR_622291 [Caerostris darwini]|uniref:BTB domain-containing protein n=1 Tax=Caerostris darwini TaxID=1538125 RepID=A0AAV4QGP5_9ARAC|nr:hypothetical protein CDAR_622291 [Caerostris darwini]
MFADEYTVKAHSVILSLQSPKCGLFLARDSSGEEIPTVVQTTIADISILRWAIYLQYMDGDVDGALRLSFESYAWDLVKIAQEFVLRNEQVVFGTAQWRRFEQQCPDLVSDTMAMYAERKLFASSKTRLLQYSPSF